MCSPSEESATHTFLPGPFRILFRRTGEHRIQSEFSVLLQIKSVLSSIQLSVCVCESYYNHYAKFATTLFFLWSSHTYICFCKQLTTAFPVKQWHFCMHRWFSSSLRRRHHLSFHHRMPSKFRCIFVSLQQISCYFQIIATYKTQFVLLFFAAFFLVCRFVWACVCVLEWMCVSVVLCSLSIWKSRFLCILFCGTQIKSYLSFGSSLNMYLSNARNQATSIQKEHTTVRREKEIAQPSPLHTTPPKITISKAHNSIHQ